MVHYESILATCCMHRFMCRLLCCVRIDRMPRIHEVTFCGVGEEKAGQQQAVLPVPEDRGHGVAERRSRILDKLLGGR